jgi:hypothetical protein
MARLARHAKVFHCDPPQKGLGKFSALRLPRLVFAVVRVCSAGSATEWGAPQDAEEETMLLIRTFGRLPPRAIDPAE